MNGTPGEGALAAPARNRRVIVWFRRDLRLADNPALAAALRMAPEVIPVYVWAPEEEGQFQPGRCSRWWLHHSLAALDRDLRALGCRMLYYRSADSRALLARLATQLGAQAVLFNHLYDPISMVRDNEVKAGLGSAGIFCQSFNADILREPWEVLDSRGKPFTCYDAFWAAHCALPYPPPPPLPIPSALPPLARGLEVEAGSLSLAELGIMSAEEEMSNAQLEYHWQPGSAGAHRLLDEFVRSGRLQAFDRDRAKTDRASTSRLSPHIHYGEVSVRHIHYVAKQQELEWGRMGEGGTSVRDFLRQLGYREYSRYLSFHFPFTHERSLLEHLRAVPWRFDQRLFKAWRQGRTGYPLVDAAMREVWGTGWMHNRMRVVAASFMVKNLLLPWQWGLKHYWDALLDADLECDALGWQYVAGCMADAHDFSTTIDHHTEAKRFDPDGHYVRRWLPVLARLPAKYIHEPWLAPEGVLDDAGVELGVNYPYPVIGVEESLASLAAANAVVQQCLRADAGGAPQPGPFRPATDADPEEAERLFEENYKCELLYGPVPATKAAHDRAEGCGATEDVQSAAGPTDTDLASVYQPGSSLGAARPAEASVAAPAARRWDAPSGTATATDAAAGATTGAASAAAAPRGRQPQGKRPAEAIAAAAAAAAAGAEGEPSSQGGEQQQAQARGAIQVPGWHPFTTAPPGGGAAAAGRSNAGSGSGSGHASMSGVAAVVPSLSREAAAAARAPAPRQLAASGQEGRQGSSSPGSGSGGKARAAAAAAASGDTAGQHWLPARQRMAAGASVPAQPCTASTTDAAPASLKRLRARSPSPPPAS